MSEQIPSISAQSNSAPARESTPASSGPTSEDRGRKRYSRILGAGLSAIASKGVLVGSSLISIPIAVRYLGATQFGIWTTINTTLTMLLVLDLGIANTLTNLISEAFAREDRVSAGSYSSTAFWLMTAVSCLLGLLGWVVWPFLDWNTLFHSETLPHNMASQSVAVAFVVFLVGMPAGLAAKLLGGYQELGLSNIFTTVGGLGSLVGIVLAVHFHGNLPVLVGASSGAVVLANGICLLSIWTRHKPWLAPWPSQMSWSVGRRLLHSGSEFFIIQLAGLVVFNSDNLVIAHYAGPADVTPYNVTWRLVGYASILQTLMLPALWPAYAEAFVRGEMAWIRSTFRKTMFLTMGVAFVCCMVFLVAGRTLIRYWAGPAVVPSPRLLLWMCVWVMISTFMNNTATVLAAKGDTKLQAWCSVGAAVMNLVLSIWLVQRIGSVGVLLGTILAYIFVLLVPQTLQTWKALYAHPAPHLDLIHNSFETNEK